ncbi:MAG: glycosyltransferase family 4 protein [bacterium]|nr:glycosyltransferase family 4 protein [bacterium]
MHVAVMTLNSGRGSGVVARKQVQALLERGHRVTYMHPAMTDGVPGADNRDIRLHSNVMPVHEYLPVHDENQRRVSSMPTGMATRYAADYVAALADLGPVDLILAHHATVTAVAARAVARARGIPYVVFVHGTGIEPRFSGGFTDAIWRNIAGAVAGAAGVIVTTPYVRDKLTTPLIDLPLDRFEVLPCGVDLDEFRPDDGVSIRQKYDLPERYVISPGALTYSKGPQNVVAASRFYSDLAPTVFAGDGDLACQVAGELGDRGRLLGYVSHEDKAALISNATILTAAPVKREHFGIIYIEALAAGTPPVAYAGGGVDSIVSPCVGSLTARAPRDLGIEIRRLLLADERRRLMGIAGRVRAESLFDQRQIGTRFVDWIEGLQSAGRTREHALTSIR